MEVDDFIWVREWGEEQMTIYRSYQGRSFKERTCKKKSKRTERSSNEVI